MWNRTTLEWLARAHPHGRVWAVDEGTVVLPTEPLLEFTASLPFAQLLEAALLNAVHRDPDRDQGRTTGRGCASPIDGFGAGSARAARATPGVARVRQERQSMRHSVGRCQVGTDVAVADAGERVAGFHEDH